MGKPIKNDYYNSLANNERRDIASFRKAGIPEDKLENHKRLRDIYAAMATLDDDAFYDIWDAALSYDLVYGYVLRAAGEAGFDDKAKESLCYHLRGALDDLRAREALYIAEHYTPGETKVETETELDRFLESIGIEEVDLGF